ncbi:hypothetical protein B4U80_12188, partial [Leptotrombidium deliense]
YRRSYNRDAKDNYGSELDDPKTVVVARKQRAVVRWRLKHMVKDAQEYALQQLTLYVPFRRFEDLFTENRGTKQDALYECMIRQKIDPEKFPFGESGCLGIHFLDAAEAKGFDPNKLYDLGVELMNQGFIESDIFNEWSTHLDFSAWKDLTGERGQVEEVVNSDDRVDFEVTEEQLKQAVDQLGKNDQYKIYEQVRTWAQDQQRYSKQAPKIFVTGGAGVGKTYTLSVLVKMLNFSRVPFQVLGTTGVAAKVANGTTIHHFFKLRKNNSAALDPSSIEADVIRNVEVIIIDEVSMLSYDVFQKIEKMLRQFSNPKIQESYAKLFGGRAILMFGDPAQLPTVQAVGIWSTNLFCDVFKVFNLKRIVRQQDQEFQVVLNKIRLGNVDSQVEKFLTDRETKIESENLEEEILE